MIRSFADLGLTDALVRAVTAEGYTTPTPIQAQAIPAILAGRDVLAGAQTGTGKTAGFALPLLQRLATHANTSTSPARHAVRGLILTPTRELAAQVEQSVRTYGKFLALRTTVVYGGVGMTPQIDTLRRGVDILVATPGRLLDHMRNKSVDLARVEVLILDEADRMLDMGFLPDIRRILAVLPSKRQNLLFSATFSGDIRKLADGLLDAPLSIEAPRRNLDAELVTQHVHHVAQDRKRHALSHLIRSRKLDQVLVFSRTKHGASRLADQLEREGITAAAIHGNKSQSQRTKALAEFKQSKVRVLVATDIAARGLDIDALPHVVNYDLPRLAEDYVHRIGRTGRAGNAGEAISLVSPDERPLLNAIESLLKRKLAHTPLAGFAEQAPPLEATSKSQLPEIARRPQAEARTRVHRSDRSRRGAEPAPIASVRRPSADHNAARTQAQTARPAPGSSVAHRGPAARAVASLLGGRTLAAK